MESTESWRDSKSVHLGRRDRARNRHQTRCTVEIRDDACLIIELLRSRKCRLSKGKATCFATIGCFDDEHRRFNEREETMVVVARERRRVLLISPRRSHNTKSHHCITASLTQPTTDSITVCNNIEKSMLWYAVQYMQVLHSKSVVNNYSHPYPSREP